MVEYALTNQIFSAHNYSTCNLVITEAILGDVCDINGI